jgi:hypothetical protein
VPDGKKFVRSEVKKYYSVDGNEDHVFVGDTRSTKFHFPNARSGTVTHMEYEMLITDPSYMPSIFLKWFQPTERQTFTLSVADGIEFVIDTFNVGKTMPLAQVTRIKGGTLHHYSIPPSKEIRYEQASPEWRWYVPHFVPRIVSYTEQGKMLTVARDLNDLGNTYREWVNSIAVEDTATVNALAKEIVDQKKDANDKMRAIYQWVQANIRYLAYADGNEGFVPRPAARVIKERFGDCKGMTNLMYNLGVASGLKVERGWVGTRDLPYKYSVTPSGLVDNHMILVYYSDDTTFFLDATGKHTPFGLPTDMIQGKEVFTFSPDGEYQILEVPVLRAARNRMIDTVMAHINGNDLIGHVQGRLSGYMASDWANKTSGVNARDLQTMVHALFRKGDARCDISKFSGTMDPTGEFYAYSYDIRIPDHIMRFGNSLVMRPMMVMDFGYFKSEAERKSPIEARYCFNTTNSFRLDLPPGFKIDALPADVTATGPGFQFTSDFSAEPDHLLLNFSSEVSELIIAPEAAPELFELNAKFEKVIKTVVSLSEK